MGEPIDAGLFRIIRDVKGAGLKPSEVARINDELVSIGWKQPEAPANDPHPDAGPGHDYVALLEHVTGRTADEAMRGVAKALTDHAPSYGQGRTPERMAEFVAQIAHETGGFTRFSENLNYSAARLVQVWPGKFPNAAAAAPYAHNPEALANKTYGGRGGNTQPGDGWRFRGRGALQLTFRDNYRVYGELTGLDLVNNPDIAADPYNSVIIALAFFKQGKVNDAIDAGDFLKARKITNGSVTTPAAKQAVADVAALRKRALEVLR